MIILYNIESSENNEKFSEADLTQKELEYLNCNEKMIGAAEAFFGVILGLLVLMVSSIMSPSAESNVGGSYFSKKIRQIKYKKYKKAVLRKASKALKKSDLKTLVKLNHSDFALNDPKDAEDELKAKIYNEYMKNHNDN